MIFTHSNRITAKFVSLLAVTSMILSAFPASFFIAFAADTLTGPTDTTVDNTAEFSTGTFDASGHTNLMLSFDFNAEALDGAGGSTGGTPDSFTYGWRSGAVDTDIATFDGVPEPGTVGDETDSVTVGLPAGAQVADLEIYISVDANTAGSADEVVITNLTVTGDALPEIPDCDTTDTVAETTFDTFSLGDVDAQNDWSSTGSFDQEVVENTYGYDSFGCQSLRISNAVTSGSFGDQTFAAPFADSVGEVDATADGFPEGTRHTHYEAEFDIASTKPDEQQSGLALSVSPDRGDGSRMSYLAFVDGVSGIDVTFYDTQGTTDPAGWTPASLGTLDRSEPHTIKFVIDTVDGHSNDIVKIYIDGVLEHTGTTWENYYRFDSEAVAEQSPRLLKTILFRASGTAAPGTSGEGFLIDNLSLEASTPAEGPKTSETIEVLGDTAAGENQEGWLFNRDLNNATPIEFNTDEASIGDGALYVEPLTSEAARKFIGEYFLLDEIANIDEISYDFLIGSGGTGADANEFYMNVYANYGESAGDKYYDCKYDVVPTVGSTGSFTTITFDPTLSYPVTTRGGASASPYTCPSVPAAMNFQSPDSTIRMFALNMGDTTAGDAGLDGYFDNVIVETKTKVTTFDFDPDTTKPTVNIDSPAHAEIVGTDVDVVGTASDADSGIEKVLYTVTQIAGIGCSSCFLGNIDSGTATGTESWNFSLSGLATGFYRLKVQAFDFAGNWKYDFNDIEVDAEKPNVTIETPDHGEVFEVGTVHATGTATDGQTSIVEVKYTVTEIDAIGGTYVANIASGIATGTSEWDFVVELLDPGFYRLKVQAFDEDGNWRYKHHDIEVIKALASLEITNPATDGETLEGEHTFEAEYTDDDDTVDTIHWALKTGGTCESNNTSVNVAGFGTPGYAPATYNPVTGEIEVTVDMSTWDDGEYCFVVNPKENGGETDTERATRTFFLDNPEPIACVPGVNILENPSFEEPVIKSSWALVDPIVWVSHKLAGGAETVMEIQRGVFGWDSSDGDQHAELATTEATRLSQTVETIPGKEYTLSWDYSARPNTDKPESKMVVRVNGSKVDTNNRNGQDDVNWKSKDYTFIADSTETTVSFEDKGNGVAGLGPLLDNTSLTCNTPDEPELEYGPYCGDGEINQDWEQCELGEEGCTNYCTLANQCSALQLVKIDLDDDSSEVSKSFDGNIYLGSSANPIPDNTWFLFDEDGDDSYVTIANEGGNEGGLAVERDTEGNKLLLAFRGGNSSKMLDIVSGTIETKGIELGSVDETPNPTYKLETSAPAFIDIFDVNASNTEIVFDLRADTGHDGVSVEVEASEEEYDCPDCRAIVEARIILNDSGKKGFGQSNDTKVHLGDGSTVKYGEWFPITEDSLGTYIDDPKTATNMFKFPGLRDGLFVSREGDGSVNVVLYGGHKFGGKFNNEWVDARIEFRDAEVATSSVEELQGFYGLEKHIIFDGIPSNNGFDKLTADTQGVDFKLWVSPSADGFEVSINPETFDSCEEDDEGQDGPDTYEIDGFKWNDEDGDGYWDEGEDPIEGWTIYAEGEEGLLSTTTDMYGYYYFEVEAGEWEVSENMEEGWQQTGLVNYMYPVFDTLITEDIVIEPETTCEFLIGGDFLFKSEYEYGYRCDFGNQEIPEEELPVCNLSASDAKVEKGETVTLSWSVGNAISVFIDNGIGSVATSGSEVVQIDNDTTFTMTIMDEEEEESSCSVTVEGVPGGSSSLSSSNNGGGDAETGTPSVLGASTSAPQCGMYLYDYLKKGESNAIFEVQKLQLFLLSQKFYSVGLSGIFDDATETAVKSFQSAYSDDVLMPWVNAGLMDTPTPTGYVYKTTRWKINDLVCPGSEAVPDVTNG